MAAEVLVSQGWVRTEIAMLISDSKGNTVWRNFVSYIDIRNKTHTHSFEFTYKFQYCYSVTFFTVGNQRRSCKHFLKL